MGLLKRKKKKSVFKKTDEMIPQEKVEVVEVPEVPDVRVLPGEEEPDEEEETIDDEAERAIEELESKPNKKSKSKVSEEEEEEIPDTIVVKELPTQPITEYQLDKGKGKTVKILTIEEALGRLIKDISEIKEALFEPED